MLATPIFCRLTSIHRLGFVQLNPLSAYRSGVRSPSWLRFGFRQLQRGGGDDGGRMQRICIGAEVELHSVKHAAAWRPYLPCVSINCQLRVPAVHSLHKRSFTARRQPVPINSVAKMSPAPGFPKALAARTSSPPSSCSGSIAAGTRRRDVHLGA